MTNRLISQKSPYLLQHAHNPVDWYPWGEEAFAQARAQEKPVFLSIGYATCHWCHVMERESFEDAAVAALLNEAFVCVKVDREERPDIDQVYMTVCQALTRSGGWPLTIVMTPDQQPFFAATYIPPESRYGRLGLRELIPRLQELWRQRRGDAETLGRHLAQALREQGRPEAGPEPGEVDWQRAYRGLAGSYDAQHGGFGEAPKFPIPHHLLFLLRYWRRTADPQALAMVEGTLRSMRRGGVCDQIGGGFHRYSTDARWLVPHFEKMLYDQALLTLAYLETYQATGREEYARTAREVLAYVQRDLSAPAGFYSAQDADSEGEEGKYYVWAVGELQQALGAAAVPAMEAWNVQPEGNFAEEATGRLTGANILHLAPDAALPGPELAATADTLLALRRKRVPPLLDDKILTDWNGLMIAALARASRVLGEPAYRESAAQAAAFLLAEMITPQGRLLHRYRQGEAAIAGYLDDYAFLTWGLLELYAATHDPAWLRPALHLTETMLAHFSDDLTGALYLTPDDGEALLVRPQEAHDGALPAGSSVALYNLLRLARLTGRADLEAAAARLARAQGGAVRQAPLAHTAFLGALDLAVGATQEVVITGRRDDPLTADLLATAEGGGAPERTVLLVTPETAGALAELAPFTAGLATDGAARAHVCQQGACGLPAAGPADLRRQLRG